jgi:acetyltransferase-like isoleucine patch superfamily enzyme
MADAPVNDAPYRLIEDVEFGDEVHVGSFTNLYGCSIGSGTRIGPFVEMQCGARVGERCKVSSHTFICDGVVVGDEVFIGHCVLFVNDIRPRATNDDGTLQAAGDWELTATFVDRRASIGSGAVILAGVRIGAGTLVGAGAVVTHDVAPGETVAGVPARVLARETPRRSSSPRTGGPSNLVCSGQPDPHRLDERGRRSRRFEAGEGQNRMRLRSPNGIARRRRPGGRL